MVLTGNGNEESQEATGANFRLRLLASQAVRAAEALRAPAADTALAAPGPTAHPAAPGQPHPGHGPEPAPGHRPEPAHGHGPKPAHAARGAAPHRQQERRGDVAAAGGTPGL